MIAWLKFIHVGAIAIWMAGLIGLPGLYVQRTHVTDDDQLFRLQRMVRFAFLRLVSPAAFVAVATGIGLIFARAVFEPWLSAKLALVGALALIHTLVGLVMIRLFEKGEAYPLWRVITATFITLTLISGVLFLVLAKPRLDIAKLVPAAMSEPGALHNIIEDLSPWPIP